MNKRIMYFVFMTCVIAFTGGYGVGYFHDRLQVPEGANAQAVSETRFSLDAINKAWDILEKRHVGTKAPTVDERIYGMISGLADSYGDPYTTFFPPTENKEFNEELNGSFEGVGMEVDKIGEYMIVVSPLKGSPAMKAGMQAGDTVLSIDGTSTKDISLAAGIKLIRGKKGTTVVLTVLREGILKPFTVSIVRDVIRMDVVETEISTGKTYVNGVLTASTNPGDKVFIIKLNSFTQDSPALMKEALLEFANSGSQKLILDLRNNPGGYLDASIKIAGLFLKPDTVVVIEDMGGDVDREVHKTTRQGVLVNEKVKMAVLVNGGSASASEILAGALSEQNRAVLVGSKTFGKGSVQELIPLTADTTLKVTIAQWLTPKGISISKNGLVPQIPVTMSATSKTDTQKDMALQYLWGKTGLIK